MRPFRLCRLLAEKGHDVTVITTDFNFASGEIEGPEKEEIKTSGKPITIHRIPSNRCFTILSRITPFRIAVVD